MSATEERRVLIAEDHPVARQGIVHLINQDPGLRVCAEVAGVAEAMAAAPYTHPDIAVVDIGLADGSGLELIRRLRGDYPELPALVLSMHGEVFYAERALRAGARGYITKAETCDHILQAVHDVLDGRIYVSGDLANQMLSGLVRGKDAGDGFSINKLTDREFEIFELLGRGLQTREIAARLHISVGTVDAHREHIKKKLNIDSAGKLLVRAIRWMECGGGL